MRGLYYEDFTEGCVLSGTNVTMTDAHITTFAGLTGDFNPLHLDGEYCKKTRFGDRIAHGLLTLSMVVGQVFHPLVEGTALANIGASVRFTAPVRIGDTLIPSVEVLKKEPKKNSGLVRFRLICKNQHDADVLEGEISLLVICKQ